MRGRTIGLVLVILGCGKAPVEGAVRQLGAGEAARMSFSITGGMTGTVWKVEVDSATGAYATSCTSQRGFNCALPERRGTLTRAQVDPLFADAGRAEFKALKPEYDMSGTFVDGPGYALSVVASGATREVRWSDAARPLPAALSRVVDALRSATGTAE